MNKEDLLEYLNNIIKPAIEDYAKENNITVEELLNEILKENNKSKTNFKKKK